MYKKATNKTISKTLVSASVAFVLLTTTTNVSANVPVNNSNTGNYNVVQTSKSKKLTTQEVYKEVNKSSTKTKTLWGIEIKGTKLSRYIQYNIMNNSKKINIKSYEKYSGKPVTTKQLNKAINSAIQSTIINSLVVNHYMQGKTLHLEMATPKGLTIGAYTEFYNILVKDIKSIKSENIVANKYKVLFDSIYYSEPTKYAKLYGNSLLAKDTYMEYLLTGKAVSASVYYNLASYYASATGLEVEDLSDYGRGIEDTDKGSRIITAIRYTVGLNTYISDIYLSKAYEAQTGVAGYFNNLPEEDYLKRLNTVGYNYMLSN